MSGNSLVICHSSWESLPVRKLVVTSDRAIIVDANDVSPTESRHGRSCMKMHGLSGYKGYMSERG